MTSMMRNLREQDFLSSGKMVFQRPYAVIATIYLKVSPVVGVKSTEAV